MILTFGLLMNTAAAQTASEIDKNKESPAYDSSKSVPKYNVQVKVLEYADLEKLLNQRLNGGLGYEFSQFANMFFVRSRIDLGTAIGLMTKDKAIAEARLEPAFSSTYEPTLREFLDALAMQTKSRWVYEPKNQVMKSDTPQDKVIEQIANIEFVPTAQTLPFEMTPANGWKTQERSNWIMYVPPIAPMAMDFHISGKISSPEKAEQAKLLRSAPIDAALDSLRRVNT
jgi:hypothetical protein